MLNSLGQISSSPNNNNLNASNIPLPPGSPPSTPNYDIDMQHQQQQQQQQQQQLQSQQQTPLQYYTPQPAFGSVKEPVTFASLAKKTDNVVSETLSQYGPVMPTMIGSPIPTIGQQNISTYPPSMTVMPTSYNLHQGQPQYNHYTQTPILSRANSSILTSPPPVYNIQPHISSTSYMQPNNQSKNLHQQNYTGPTLSSASYQHPGAVIMGRPATISVLNHVPSASNSNNPLVNSSQSSSQPVASISPPLDPLRDRSQHDSSANNNQPSEVSQSFNVVDDIKKRCENMVLNQVLEEHRHLKFKLQEFQKKRQSLDTDINDMRRNLPGHCHLDTHPKYIRLKEKHKECDLKCKQYSDAMKYVTGILDTKWQHVVPQDSDVQQPLQRIKKNQPPTRAKMSTATPPAKPEKDQTEDANMLLDLEDGNTWCKVCDLHFTTFKEYLEHLHTRTHVSNVGQARTPWRKTSDPLPRLTLTRTYNKIKSICGQISTELKQNYSVQDLDEILNPSNKNPERLRALNLERERGKFEPKSDRLLQLKGYDQIVPIKGYYCKICDLVMCDIREGEEHERSVQHNKEYAKFVALSDTSEKKFLADMERSLKAQHQEESRERDSVPRNRVDRSREPSTSKIKELFMPHAIHPVITPAIRAERVASEVSQFSARLPYKKPTSRIVDDHEVIAEKFDKREEEKNNAPKHDEKQTEKKRDEQKADDRSLPGPVAGPSKRAESSHNRPSSKSGEALPKRKLPEIVPIKKSSSGALKKLRRESKSNDRDYNEESTDKVDEPVIKSVKEPPPPPPRASSKQKVTVVLTSSDEDDAPLPKKPIRKENTEEPTSNFRLMEEGDPDSPFPHLELCLNGNIHRDALKSKQLFQRTKVVMNRVNLEHYKHMLLPPDDLYTRLNFLMTKKEKNPDKSDEKDEVKVTVETVIDPETGENVPIDPEDDEKDSKSSDDNQHFDMARLEDFFVSS